MRGTHSHAKKHTKAQQINGQANVIPLPRQVVAVLRIADTMPI
jgi:hypothetical protein